MALTAGCSPLGSGDGPSGVLDEFTRAVAKGDLSESLFSEPSVAAYQKVVAGMGSDPVVSWSDVEQEGDRSTATLTWHWSMPGSTWVYRSKAHLVRTEPDGEDARWRIEFRPDLVEPSLKPEEVLVEQSIQPPRAEILAGDGTALVTERPVARVGLDKTKVTDQADLVATANQLARAVGIKPDDYLALAQKMGPNAFVPAIVYRQAELPNGVAELARRLPAVLILSDQLALAPTKQFAAPLLGSVGSATAELIQRSAGRITPGDLTGISGLQLRYDEQLAGTDGTKVVASSEQGRRTLFAVDPQPGQPLQTTLDQRLQAEAEKLLSGVHPASALVAIQPSTGDLLAIANGPGTDGQNIATYGRYAPGSTFKMVTALGLLRTGLTPESEVSCPESTTVNGKEFSNYPDYPASALGEISLTDAIAHSCNTAMITAGSRARKLDLDQAAGSLGFGVDHDLGFPAYFGELPRAASETEAAADLIGQGRVTASPMAIATMMASIVEGQTVVPRLLPAHEVAQESDRPTALTAEESAALREMLGAVVTRGSGGVLKGLGGPEVIAKTGTAQYGDQEPYPTHAWMVAGQGDLAVAVFVATGASGSQTAGPILKSFLAQAAVRRNTGDLLPSR
ncbi:MAG TPA: penicillin-binding transpeptidase domain-containing protein [Marmoricola sp.]|nr:penicillin-binding transpeptidase domain-containing protein [Marmoricola sp.]